MSEVKSFRKPYNPPVKKMTWWLENSFYTKYMIREGTAVLALFAVLEIVFGIFMLALCDIGPIPTLSGIAPYAWYLQSFLGNPVIIALNVIVLVSQLYHAVTWFALMPAAVRVFMNKNSTEMLPRWIVTASLYAALAGATVVILGVAFLTV